MNPDHSISLAVNVSQSVSQWNAWPATGRSALQDLRSWAILQASLALSPVSSSICCTHVRQSLPKIFEARPIRLSISGVERSDKWISLPRYVKRPVDSMTWHCNCNCTGAGVTPWLKFWILVFDQEVFRPIVSAASSKPERIYGHLEGQSENSTASSA